MRIEHIAIWVKDIEKIRSFYEKYFSVTSSELYHNQKTGFRSYFLSVFVELVRFIKFDGLFL